MKYIAGEKIMVIDISLDIRYNAKYIRWDTIKGDSGSTIHLIKRDDNGEEIRSRELFIGRTAEEMIIKSRELKKLDSLLFVE